MKHTLYFFLFLSVMAVTVSCGTGEEASMLEMSYEQDLCHNAPTRLDCSEESSESSGDCKLCDADDVCLVCSDGSCETVQCVDDIIEE